MSASETAASAAASTVAAATAARVLVQYIVVRKDLLKTLAWPIGSVIGKRKQNKELDKLAVAGQGCHATAAVLSRHRDDPAVLAFTSPENLPNMHTVVYEVKGEPQLQALADSLVQRNIKHHLWREQPENIITALATTPYTRDEVGDAFKKCSLFR